VIDYIEAVHEITNKCLLRGCRRKDSEVKSQRNNENGGYTKYDTHAFMKMRRSVIELHELINLKFRMLIDRTDFLKSPHMLPLVLRFFPPLRRVFLRYTSTTTLATMSPTPWTPNSYPPARRSDHIEAFKSASAGDVRVPDPYQWLEEYTDETDKWTSAQEAFTRSYLDKNPDLPRLEAAFRSSNDYAKVILPSKLNEIMRLLTLPVLCTISTRR
jgi:hypothetical protein